jgi:hypothetical protein
MGGVAKEYITELGCEKHFPEGHILSTNGDALSCLSNTLFRTFSPNAIYAENLTQQ